VKAAVVLIVRDWEVLNEAYGLDYAFWALGRAGLSQPYYILVSEGFEKVPAEFIGHWRERNILIEDAAAVQASLFEDHPWLEGLPDNATYRVTFLRHLILQRRFEGEAVLSVDADVVWRMDPYRLFADWTGGYFAAGDSGFLVHASSPEWFEAYRTGLESALTGGALTADFSQPKFGINKVLHDQHLLQHLQAKGLMWNAWEAARASPALGGLALMANPLHPKQGLADPPPRLSFQQDEDGEWMSGGQVAFWHMQSSFVALCSFKLLTEALTFEHGGRLPFPRPKAGRDNLKAALLQQMRELIVSGRLTDDRFARLRPQMFRRGVYKAFFAGDLARELFTDALWWETGVFG
jgi:hypothetical protein